MSANTPVGVDDSRADEEPVVSLKDVSVHYNTQGYLERLFSDEDRTVRAVDGVSLDIYENDVVALVGESGCGKTTLGKTAIGAERPTEGTVEYRGQDIWAAKDGRNADIPFEEIRRSLQIIHQDPGSSLNPNHTVMSTLSVPLKRWHKDLSAEDREARILNMLQIVGMTPAEDYAKRYPHQLSGGEKQRVAMIRALLMNPDVILADEAVSALDVSLRIEMMDLMLELQDQFNTSFVFVAHDLSNARYLAEKAGGRIGVMYLGEIVEIGSVREIADNPKHPYTQTLRWATPSMNPDKDVDDEPPVRNIDIPDPINPPSGCRFHTRCPKAREICTDVTPELTDATGEDHPASCFRQFDDHEYWDSDPLPGTDPTKDGAGQIDH
jgi:peptide/nickel transport system ATP-binding protein